MLVDLQKKWFAPTEPFTLPDGRKIAGQRYSKGIQEVPDHLLDLLPPGTKVLKHPPVEEKQEEVIETLRDHDHARSAMESFDAFAEQGEERRMLNLEPTLQEIFPVEEVKKAYTGKTRGRKPGQKNKK
jgi:hypothetical protein